jgi:exonuclease SbcC
VLAEQQDREADLAELANRLAETRTKAELAAAALEGALATSSLPALPEAKGEPAAQLKAWAKCCRSCIVTANEAVRSESKTSDRAIRELRRIVVPLGLDVGDGETDDVLVAIDRNCKDAYRLVVETEGAHATLKAKVEGRRQMEKAIGSDALLSRQYEMLGKELQQNNFIAFVLGQSMERLAALATGELLKISDGRYSLAAEADGFDVIDHHNADERRSVATLSGGETFLGSLALALALAGSVRDLAGAAAAGRLDAMFIDEGFGALDPETLEIVVDALERLREGERMVGVISHVGALAERIPAGLVVTKNGGASTVTVR